MNTPIVTSPPHSRADPVTGYPFSDTPLDGGAYVALRPTLEAERHCDTRDRERVFTPLDEWRPEIVFHLAAQALVPEGHRDPIGTFETNVTGTVNVISAAVAAGARAVVVVTKATDSTERLWRHALRELITRLLPRRRPRANPRVVKRKYTRWHVKRSRHRDWPQPTRPPHAIIRP